MVYIWWKRNKCYNLYEYAEAMSYAYCRGQGGGFPGHMAGHRAGDPDFSPRPL